MGGALVALWALTALTLIALAALVDVGPGSPSVDRALGIERSGSGWALAALAAGAAGSTIAVESVGAPEEGVVEPVPQAQDGQRREAPVPAGV